MASQHILGGFQMMLGIFINVYVTCWWLVKPSLDLDNPVNGLFPLPYMLLIVGPVLQQVLLLSGVSFWVYNDPKVQRELQKKSEDLKNKKIN